MELNIYNTEKFERDKRWYTIFTTILIIVFLISIFYKNIVGIIIMFFLLGGYIYYGLINIQETKIIINDTGMILGGKMIPWTTIKGYCIEINKEDQSIKNIVLVGEKRHSIYTINDNIENIEKFFNNLSNIVPMLDDFPQTLREKIIRNLKL